MLHQHATLHNLDKMSCREFSTACLVPWCGAFELQCSHLSCVPWQHRHHWNRAGPHTAHSAAELHASSVCEHTRYCIHKPVRYLCGPQSQPSSHHPSSCWPAADASTVAVRMPVMRLSSTAEVCKGPVWGQRHSVSVQETVEALQEQLRDLRLSHRRELRLKARDAAAAHEELQAARAKVRELNVKTRHLQSVRPAGPRPLSCLPLSTDHVPGSPPHDAS